MSTRVSMIVAMAGLLATMAPFALGETNLRSTKSNVYRLVYPPAVTSAQAEAILTELDQAKPEGNADEASVRTIVNKHVGVIKSVRTQNLVIVIRPTPSPGEMLTTVFLLENAADEADAALAIGGVGGARGPMPKGKTSTK